MRLPNSSEEWERALDVCFALFLLVAFWKAVAG